MADNGAHSAEEDPAAAFLAQQESEIAGIENDGDGFAEPGAADSQQSANYGELAPELTLLLAGEWAKASSRRYLKVGFSCVCGRTALCRGVSYTIII